MRPKEGAAGVLAVAMAVVGGQKDNAVSGMASIKLINFFGDVALERVLHLGPLYGTASCALGPIPSSLGPMKKSKADDTKRRIFNIS